MRRYKLTPSLRYVTYSLPQRGIRTVSIEETAEGESLQQQQNRKAVNFTEEEEKLLNIDAMPNQPGNTLYEIPAYEISRVITSENDNQTLLEPIPQENIIRLESVSNYCYIYTNDNQRTLMAVSLGNVLKHMTNFLRIHRKHAINELYIKQRFAPIQKSDNGERFLILTTGERIPWSRRVLTDMRKDPDEAHLYKKVPKRVRKPKSKPETPTNEPDNPDHKKPARQTT